MAFQNINKIKTKNMKEQLIPMKYHFNTPIWGTNNNGILEIDVAIYIDIAMYFVPIQILKI